MRTAPEGRDSRLRAELRSLRRAHSERSERLYIGCPRSASLRAGEPASPPLPASPPPCPGRGQARLARAGEGSIHKQSLTCILIARCARLPRSASLKAGSVEGLTRSDFLPPERDQRSAVKSEKSRILSFYAWLA